MRRKIRMVHGGYSIAGQIGQGPKRNHKKGFRPTYLKTIHNQLSAILNYAVNFYDLRANPCYKAGSMGKSKADARLDLKMPSIS